MITNDDMDLVFQALSNRTRRAILDLLVEQPGQTVGELASNFEVSRIAVMNHLTVMERAQLISSEKEGRSRRIYLNVMPIQLIYDRWTDAYSGHWASKLSMIKFAAEQTENKKEKAK